MSLAQSKERGQAALLTVMMISIVMTTMAYFALNRSLATRKFTASTSMKARASEALEVAAVRLYRVYVDEAACDPGLLLGSRSMTPFTLTSTDSRVISGAVIPFVSANIAPGAQGYDQINGGNSHFNQKNTDYFIVNYGPILTLERTDLDATDPNSGRQNILYYNSPGGGSGDLSVVSLGSSTLYNTARSPVTGPPPGFAAGGNYYFDASAVGATPGDFAVPTPLGARDMSIELSVAFPPTRPQFVMRQIVAFLDVCTIPYRNINGVRYQTHYFDLTDSAIGNGPTGRICRTGTPDVLLGALNGGTTRIGPMIEMMRDFINKGFLEFGANFASTAELSNCADVNRDGLVTEADLGILEKHLSGYNFYIPPIFPEYKGGADSAHNLQ